MADDIKQEVAKEVKLMKSQVGKAPGLAVIVAGSQRSSMLYVQNKTIACEEVGISSACEKLPEDVSEEQILATIRKYNEDPSTHGILVQLPLPKVNAHTDNTNSVQIYAAKYGHPLFACSTGFLLVLFSFWSFQIHKIHMLHVVLQRLVRKLQIRCLMKC